MGQKNRIYTNRKKKKRKGKKTAMKGGEPDPIKASIWIGVVKSVNRSAPGRRKKTRTQRKEKAREHGES